MAQAFEILNAITALKTPKTASVDNKVSAIRAVATVLIQASQNSVICSLINPTDAEKDAVVKEAEAAITLVNDHRDELTEDQIDNILDGLRKTYFDADKRAMDNLTGKFAENPNAKTVEEAVNPTHAEQDEQENSDDFDPETDLQLQGDPTEQAEQPAEQEDPIVNFAKNLKQKAPAIVDLLKTIFA